MTEIKHKAGDTVYWLSNRGFSKGYIKTIRFTDEINGDARQRTKKLSYFIKEEKDNGVYMGDEVSEDLVFLSYKEMLEFYSNKNI